MAIKLLTPALCHGATARRRFAREARAVAAVGHEHIVAIHAVDEFRGLPYLVMQYVPGRSLQERLDASGPLEVREILRIGTQAAPRFGGGACAGGCAPRHQAGEHLARELHRASKAYRLRPGQGDRRRQPDSERLDRGNAAIYGPRAGPRRTGRCTRRPVCARGALYAMAAGRSPFRADSTMAVLKRVCEARHRPIRELNPDVPDWLEATIDRLLAKEPADRFQTATEVADLLEKGLAHLQQPTILPPPVVFGIAAKSGSNLDLDFDPPSPKHLPRRVGVCRWWPRSFY